jgi:hypothetical protein
VGEFAFFRTIYPGSYGKGGIEKLVFCLFLILIDFTGYCQTDTEIIPGPDEIKLHPGFFLFSNCTRLGSEASLSTAVQPLVARRAGDDDWIFVDELIVN